MTKLYPSNPAYVALQLARANAYLAERAELARLVAEAEKVT